MLIIRAEDRRSFGWGHRTRAVALAEAAQRAELACTVCSVSDPDWGKSLGEAGLAWSFAPEVDGASDEAVALLELAQRKSADAIVLDGGRFSADMAKRLRQAGKFVVLINDNGSIPKPASLVVNPNIYAGGELYSDSWEGPFLLGSKFILLRTPFAKPIAKFQQSRCALVSLGGAASGPLAAAVSAALERAGYEVRMASGLSAVRMVDAINASSLVICGASVTLHEVWSRGRTALPLYQARDQHNFRTWCTKQGIAVVDALDCSTDDISARVEIAVKGLNSPRGSNLIPEVPSGGADRVLLEIQRSLPARQAPTVPESRVAVLADVHGNSAALNAVLTECDGLGITTVWFLGDLVGYGLEPAKCLQMLKRRAARWIRGNHDAELVSSTEIASKAGCASDGDLLARTQLTSEEIQFVVEAPDIQRFRQGTKEVVLCHGTPWCPMERVYPDASAEVLDRVAAEGGDITLMAHTHWAFSTTRNGRLVANPGSVGQARDVRGTASWAILDVELCSWTAMRTPYSA